jgi:hypothetical protein
MYRLKRIIKSSIIKDYIGDNVALKEVKGEKD